MPVINAREGRHGSVGMGCRAVFGFTCVHLDLQETSFWMAERRKPGGYFCSGQACWVGKGEAALSYAVRKLRWTLLWLRPSSQKGDLPMKGSSWPCCS